MEHSVQAYIRRLPTEQLKAFLKQYETNRGAESHLRGVIMCVQKELERRRREKISDG